MAHSFGPHYVYNEVYDSNWEFQASDFIETLWGMIFQRHKIRCVLLDSCTLKAVDDQQTSGKDQEDEHPCVIK